MKSINFKTPLHTFTANNLSYTVVNDVAYILGKIKGNSVNLSVNGTVIAAGTSGYSGSSQNDNVSLRKVTKDDVVAVTSACAELHVLELKE